MGMSHNRVMHHRKTYMFGSELPPEDRAEVLRRFVHRYTGEHTPAWVTQRRREALGRTNVYPVQFATDAEWLAHTKFKVTAEGRLHKGSCYCESFPTWPHNPEFRRRDTENRMSL